jgi:hypothetical protein
MSQIEVTSIIANLARLRTAAERADSSLGTELAAISEELEQLVGPTVRPADAARLLAISEPALKRWLDKGDIPSVMTPQGRREIPLTELLELLQDVEEARDAGIARPVSHAIRERKRQAAKSVDLDRLLPRPRTHRDAELLALAYHRLVAERLDERLVARARRQLERWTQTDRIQERWANEWNRVLSAPLDDIRSTISADTPRARQLRQTSPFAGVLTDQERRLLSRAVAGRVQL